MSRKSRVQYQSGHIEKLNEIKFLICNVIDHEMVRLQWTPLTLACHFGTTPSNISRVLNKKVDELTFNQLFRYLVILRPEFKCLVSPY